MDKSVETRRWEYRKILKRAPIWYKASEKLFEDRGQKEDALEVTNIYVLLPMITGFILWLLQDAKKRGKKKLYFLARDGYLMCTLARKLSEYMDLEIECKYLYCSRYAFRTAEYHLIKGESLDYICVGGLEVTFRRLMQRAGLDELETEQVKKQLSFQKNIDSLLSYSELKNIKKVLSASRDFQELIERKSKEKYPLLMNYLKQEGIFDNIPFAIVDSGWTGSMQKSLQTFVRSVGSQATVEGYYFGMYEYPKGISVEKYHTFYFQPMWDINKKIYFNNNLFECIFSAPHGMTTGYQYQGKKIIPVYDKEVNADKDRILQFEQLLFEYSKLFTKEQLEKLDNKENRKTIEKLLCKFMGQPSFQEAKEFGKYQFADDIIGQKEQNVAIELTIEQIRQDSLLHRIKGFLTKKTFLESPWIAGSTALNTHSKKRDYRRAMYYRSIRYLRKTIEMRKRTWEMNKESDNISL